jgi:hypothetical protein
MIYPETLYTAFAFAASGGAAFCALCMIAAALFHQPDRKKSFSVFCVLLSIAITSFALLCIFTPFSAGQLKIWSVVVWCISFFAGGMFLTAFYRILIPFIVSVYLLLVLLTYGIMRDRYPVLKSLVPVSVYKGTFSADGGERVFFYSREGRACIQIDVCTLPPELLVPLSRTWYAFHDSSEKDIVSSGKTDLLYTAVRKYSSYAAGTCYVINIPVPSGADTAAMYAVDFRVDPPFLIRVL